MGSESSQPQKTDGQLRPLVEGEQQRQSGGYGAAVAHEGQLGQSGAANGTGAIPSKLPPGLWKGYILVHSQHLADRITASPDRWDFDVVIEETSDHGQFSGTGKDQSGTQVLLVDGKYEDGRVTFTKEYLTHTVSYKGELRGSRIEGEWWLPSQPEHFGQFSMWLDSDFLPNVLIHQGTESALGFCRRCCVCC